MSLIIATGTNLGDKLSNLDKAKQLLSEKFNFIAESSVYESPAVGKTDQPAFYNQVLEFQIPKLSPDETMLFLLDVEKSMGRVRDEKWGPRVIDLDILFWGLDKFETLSVQIPHPRWRERAFVVKPLRELPFFQVLEKSYKIPDVFDHEANIVFP